MALRRAAFVTIGQSPRNDILSEMKPWWTSAASSVQIEQVGVLDGVEPRDLESLTASEGEECLISRLRDGTEVVLRAKWVKQRVQEIVSRLDAEAFDFLVLLCTGHFPELASKRLLLEAQSVVDHAVAALARGASRVGVLLPHEEQTHTFRSDLKGDHHIVAAHASPYSGNRFAQAAREIEDCDVIVMHCMGYSESMRHEIEERTNKPVLLARRMVASAVAQLL